MADPSTLPQTPQAPDLAQQILDAPEPVWKKLKGALGVQTREQAVELVQSDQAAAAAAAQILGGAVETVATARRAAAPPTVATSGPRAAAPLAERIYGKGKQVTF